MQKLKKSLENNILKAIFNKNCLIFNIEIGSNKNLDNSPVTYVTKTLTTNSSRELRSLCNLENYDLKYPLVLKFFENRESLNKYFDLLEEKKQYENIVISKLSNKIFKNNSYSIVKHVSSQQTFSRLKNLLSLQVNLLRVLKLKSFKN